MLGRRRVRQDARSGYRKTLFLLNVAWRFEILRAQAGWTINLQTYNIVSTGSPTFLAVKNGDVPSLRRLLSTGEASLYDVCEIGCSLLYVSLI